MVKVYFYLMKRDKKNIKIIGTLFSGKHIIPTRVTDLDLLGLKINEKNISKELIQQHRLDWEPWIECANNFGELKANLLKRGCLAPSSPNSNLLQLDTTIPDANVNKIGKNRVMTRRSN